ncbi:MAG TPA: hypothetical protein VGK18_13600 [Propionicimonas sp.]|uniref:hypothetical protein n=1 Tax=Propionicimonas sp. TaxID=1955623 RepID=UPI002F40AF39
MNDHDYWVQAAPFRALLVRLIDVTGLPWPELADHGRLPPQLVHRLLCGRDGRRVSRIPRECARRILALDERRLLRLARQLGVFA